MPAQKWLNCSCVILFEVICTHRCIAQVLGALKHRSMEIPYLQAVKLSQTDIPAVGTPHQFGQSCLITMSF
jgi:hypothetical protein